MRKGEPITYRAIDLETQKQIKGSDHTETRLTETSPWGDFAIILKTVVKFNSGANVA